MHLGFYVSPRARSRCRDISGRFFIRTCARALAPYVNPGELCRITFLTHPDFRQTRERRLQKVTPIRQSPNSSSQVGAIIIIPLSPLNLERLIKIEQSRAATSVERQLILIITHRASCRSQVNGDSIYAPRSHIALKSAVFARFTLDSSTVVTSFVPSRGRNSHLRV